MTVKASSKTRSAAGAELARGEHAPGQGERGTTESLISSKRRSSRGTADDPNVAGTEESKNSEVDDNPDGGRDALQRRSTTGISRRKQYAVSTNWEREQEEAKARNLEAGSSGCCPGPCTCSIEDVYSCCCCCARRRVGNMFFLMERADGSPRVVVGPCWPFCAFVTVPLILIVSVLVSYFIILDQAGFGMPWWIALIYFPILAVTLVTLFLVSCRDPGMLERVTDEEAGRNGWFWNEQTGSFRPSGAMYCRECKVLIQDYDHLCPWTGTGIGRGNMCAFKLFVGSVNVLCYFSIALVAYCLIRGLA